MSDAAARREHAAGSTADAQRYGEASRRARECVDVCVVGHVTRDLVRNGAHGGTQAGGTAYYATLALHALGARVAVVTRCAREDAGELLREIRDCGTTVHWRASADSSSFENTYETDAPDARKQQILAVADPFAAGDVPEIGALAVHLGPLTAGDIDAEFTASLLAHTGRHRRPLSSLDVQGLVRRVPGRRGVDAEALIGQVDILKGDAAEAAALTGTEDPDASAARLLDLGPSEVLITHASRGSVLYTAGERTAIAPARSPATIVDRTGCGDTYAAAYLLWRMQGRDPVSAAHFASTAAAAKLGCRGALRVAPGGPGGGYTAWTPT